MQRMLSGLTILFFLAAAVAEAGIGATEAQLVERFGAVATRQPERTLEYGHVFVVGERIVLKQREWRVTVVLIEGVCAKITYNKIGAWTDRQFAGLLAANADSWVWGEIPARAPKWQRTWRRADGMVAKWKYAAGFVIEAQSFVDAREHLREIARRKPALTASR